jgi:hypothetical protein
MMIGEWLRMAIRWADTEFSIRQLYRRLSIAHRRSLLALATADVFFII